MEILSILQTIGNFFIDIGKYFLPVVIVIAGIFILSGLICAIYSLFTPYQAFADEKKRQNRIFNSKREYFAAQRDKYREKTFICRNKDGESNIPQKNHRPKTSFATNYNEKQWKKFENKLNDLENKKQNKFSSGRGILFAKSFRRGLSKPAKFCARHTKIALVLGAVLIVLNFVVPGGLFNNIAKDFLERQKKIELLTKTVENLARNKEIAKITVLDKYTRKAKNGILIPVGKYKIETLDEENQSLSSQEFILEGKKLFVDSWVINFDYSEIESAHAINLGYPVAVFTDRMKPENAVKLDSMYEKDSKIPKIFNLSDEDILGMKKSEYYKTMKDLIAPENQEKNRELGIRSKHGTAVNFEGSKGEVYLIKVENSGGLSLHKKTF